MTRVRRRTSPSRIPGSRPSYAIWVRSGRSEPSRVRKTRAIASDSRRSETSATSGERPPRSHSQPRGVQPWRRDCHPSCARRRQLSGGSSRRAVSTRHDAHSPRTTTCLPLLIYPCAGNGRAEPKDITAKGVVSMANTIETIPEKTRGMSRSLLISARADGSFGHR